MDTFDEGWPSKLDQCCRECTACLRLRDNNNDQNALTKRFVTVGSVRYGVRLGAVSPPPPGAGPRYRSSPCCWMAAGGVGGGRTTDATTATVSRTPIPINSRDIFSCVHRVRRTTTTTTTSAAVCEQLDDNDASSRSQLKVRRRGRPTRYHQVYERLCDCDGIAHLELTTLDRLPRFRFGGNRGSMSNKVRERDKRSSEKELLLKELLDRHKKAPPVPPPRSRQPRSPTSTQPPEDHLEGSALIARMPPPRSASFSEVDYSAADNKYVRKTRDVDAEEAAEDLKSASGTLPRAGKHQTPLSEAAVPEDKPITHSEILRSANDTAPMHPGDTRKQDKSRRRKGMYIDHNWAIGPNSPGVLATNANDNSKNLLPLFMEAIDVPSLDIPRVQISSDPDTCPATPHSGPLSPADEEQPQEWPSRPSFSAQSSEERETLLRVSRGVQLLRADSLSEGEPEHDRRSEVAPSDASDCESRTSSNDILHIPRRYSKRPLRGPYGQMLEAEMKKPEKKNQYSDLKFLDDMPMVDGHNGNNDGMMSSTISLSPSSSLGAGDSKPKYVGRGPRGGSSNNSLDDTHLKHHSLSPSTSPGKHTVTKRKVSMDSAGAQDLDPSARPGNLVVSHQRTASSPSKLEGFTPPEASNELLEQLLRGSSEHLMQNDTRTHVAIELYDTEQHYVESLHTLVTKYLEPLKSPENAGLLDATLVDEIFYQIPTLYTQHTVFLEELKKRLDHWDVKQKVGDVLINMYSNQIVIESYSNYVNNCKRAHEIYKSAQQSKPAFARFLGAMAREHKGKLALDALLIKPIQIFPKYELLLQRLIEHTNPSHPDHSLLLTAQRELHEQILKINCTEREALGLDQLREIEGVVEGLFELVAADRQYLRHDSVHMKASSGGLKERALFLFSDLLLITSIKRRSGTGKKPGQGSVTSTLDANKYKLLMKIALDDLEIVRAKDENFRMMMLEIEKLTEDISTLNQIQDLVWSLHRGHQQLDELVKEMLANMGKQLSEQQNSDAQLCCLDLNVMTSSELISLVFSKPEKRASWEESFNEAKHKLAMSGDRRPCPELVATVPIRKTRAGLQFTCAAPTMTIDHNWRDVWVCNSDGYVGQVCVLSLHPEPTVMSCNGVCNARILCVASVPAFNSIANNADDRNTLADVIQTKRSKSPQPRIEFDSSSSSDTDEHTENEENESGLRRPLNCVKSAETASTDSDDTSADTSQSTMWLGTEDGCIHVYNSNDNIRMKKNKIRLQHGAAIYCIIYLNNRVFTSLANGDLIIYERDQVACSWNTNAPITLSIGSSQMPVSKMVPNADKLWCACGNNIKVLSSENLIIEHNFVVNNDAHKPVACLVVSGNGVWLSLQNTATVKCYHTNTFDLLCEVNVGPAVTKMLTSCDDIIRQHKAACLRVTSLLACKEILWIGTSAGVLLTMPLPHIAATTTKLSSVPGVAGVPHGHTGHVRFLSHVECATNSKEEGKDLIYGQQRHSVAGGKNKNDSRSSQPKFLVISGGDGYEDFRNSNLSEVAGREDSTNHLLLWSI